jgi:2-hydroxychromene-2-carboxylate isomerase
MKPAIEFYFDLGSPTSYLAWTQLPKIAKNVDAALVFRPILLGAVHKMTGNVSPAVVELKARWMGQDLQRFATRYGVPFAFNPCFPINTLKLMRGATGSMLKGPAALSQYLSVIFPALWVDKKNLGDAEVLAAVLSAGGMDPSALFAMTEDPAVKERLKADTDAAVARGVFGAPTMFLGDHMYFGQDRLDFLSEDLRAA